MPYNISCDVAVTNMGLHFLKQSFLGKPAVYLYYDWVEVEKIQIGKVAFPGTIKFYFADNSKIVLTPLAVGPLKLTSDIKDYLVSKK